MNRLAKIGCFLCLGTALPCLVHYLLHHTTVTPLHLFLDFFCALNILICVWEIFLYHKIDKIQRDFAKLKERFPDTTTGRLGAVSELAFDKSASLFSGATKVWSTYALYDPSYADSNSWGFWIDVGNGHTTIIPSFLFVVGSTIRIMPPKPFAIINLIVFYQELYGTVVYFASFVTNRRHADKSKLELALFVGLSNGIWILGPLLGIYASLMLLEDQPLFFYPPPRILQ